MHQPRSSETYYGFSVTYRYKIGTKEYLGRALNAGGYLPTRATVAQLLAGYQRGQEVTVWYDPNNPSRAVLEPGVSRANYWGLAGGAGLLGIGVAWFLSTL